MFTQGLSREVEPAITVNNIQSGPIDTDLNPAAGDWAVPQKSVTALDRYGHVDEVAALVSFVAGPESTNASQASCSMSATPSSAGTSSASALLRSRSLIHAPPLKHCPSSPSGRQGLQMLEVGLTEEARVDSQTPTPEGVGLLKALNYRHDEYS
jgi:hypothetical protein